MRHPTADRTPPLLQPLGDPAAQRAPIAQPAAQAYVAAMVATAVLFPLVAAMVTIAGDQANLGPLGIWATSNHAASGSLLVLCALTIGTTAWLGAAAWYRQLTGPQSANPSSFGHLRQHLSALATRLETPPACPAERPVRDEAQGYLDLLAQDLGSAGDVRWVGATGYVTAWTLTHRAEELLLQVTARDDLLRNGLYDLSRLADSHLDNRDELVRQARLALHDLGAARYLPPRRAGHSPIRQVALPGMRIARGTTVAADALERQARIALAGVRRAINEYRDSKYAGLVQARNRAARTMTITAFATYGLLALAAIDGVAKQTMVRATAIFLVGALVGLFSRLFDESRADASTTIEDYGLATIRLLTRPLLSGLAALAGVVMTISLPSAVTGAVPASPPITVTEQAPVPQATTLHTVVAHHLATTVASEPAITSASANLSAIFAIERDPFALVIAAVFGLTPGLLFGRLQKQTEDLKADLRASAPGGQSGLPDRRSTKRDRR